MNDVIKNILNRRSVRVYKDIQIMQEDLDLILKCGYSSPSACNEQPWYFTVVQNKDLIDKISEDTKKIIVNSPKALFSQMGKNEKFHVFYNAPTVIVISGKSDNNWSVVDCSSATENMILAANSLGIGTCWIGLVTALFKSEEGKKYFKELNLPEGYVPLYAISVGYKKIADPQAKPKSEQVINYIK